MKLYRVDIHSLLYVMAESEAEAKDIAVKAWPVLGVRPPNPNIRICKEVQALEDVPTDWRGTYPVVGISPMRVNETGVNYPIVSAKTVEKVLDCAPEG